jgi:hypothetical protein
LHDGYAISTGWRPDQSFRSPGGFDPKHIAAIVAWNMRQFRAAATRRRRNCVQAHPQPGRPLEEQLNA